MPSINVELNPFPIPTCVTVKQKPGRRQDVFNLSQEIKLADLTPNVLDELCEEFRMNVFNAAGHDHQRRTSVTSNDYDVLPGSQEALNRR